jgi:hypothetical protein
MESEHYRLGFKDGSERNPHKLFSSYIWQDLYNQGYMDAQKGLSLLQKGMLYAQIKRGGC